MTASLLLFLIAGAAGSASDVTPLVENGQARAGIVLASDATAAERTAAAELADHIEQITGAKLHVGSEADPRTEGLIIHLGWTVAARRAGITPERLGPEEWRIKTIEHGLVLTGGRPRGTLYAVYHFLEDVAEVHWWTPWETFVPRRASLVVPPQDRQGRPAFRYRDVYMVYGNDGGRFASRNRLNRQGDEAITAEHGGSRDYGPPYHVHTFYRTVPPEQFFKAHPEWFSLVDGKRVAEGGQLCLTNPELRRFYRRRLLEMITESKKAAREARVLPPEVFSISQNDCYGACQCDSCQALAKAEESEAGPILDFVNYLADAVRMEYPEVMLDTLAYQYSDKPPKSIRPRDDVIVRLCDTESNIGRPITHPENRLFHDRLLRWSAIAGNLRIWDYAVTYGPYSGFPMPTVQTYADDFRFYLQHNVEGVFTELEYPLVTDLRDLKLWVMIKLLEDPAQDTDRLVRTFTDGYYGLAGEAIREYQALVSGAFRERPAFLGMNAGLLTATYLNLDFMLQASACFDRAEQAVRADPVLLRRVRHARLALDRAAVVKYRNLLTEWLKSGRPAEAMPLKRDVLAQRYKAAWYEQIDLRLPELQRAAEQGIADREVASLTAWPEFVALPERFRDRPPGTVFDLLATEARNFNDIAKVQADPEAEARVTDRLVLREGNPSTEPSRYRLPIQWGVYDQAQKKGVGSGRIESAPGSGYHWYTLGPLPVNRSCYLYFFWSWIIQFDLGPAAPVDNSKQLYEIWASIKFEGPQFPHGRPDQANAICIERIVLVKAPG
jgi:hypothetical protein